MIGFGDEEVVYTTGSGSQLCGDSLDLLSRLADDSVDLIMTSPPFALLRRKAYGNEDQDNYVEWLAAFGKAAKRVLKPTGSLVIDLGNAYVKGRPTRSLYPYRVLLKFVDDLGYQLAEEFFWYNPAKLPSPIEWVNKRRIRVKDAVNTVWWLSKTDDPKANVNNVLRPYSARMTKLLANPRAFYSPRERPSQHAVSEKFGTDNGGAIPSNMLEIPNTDSNSNYLRTCRSLGVKSHPARFPEGLPDFFIRFLTDPGDLVLDIFAGSNTTGMVAERLERRWLGFELDRDYAALSMIRFLQDREVSEVRDLYELARTKPIDLDD
jgi:site-specific DNA-methyltransferase (cytosine-N4-specific)